MSTLTARSGWTDLKEELQRLFDQVESPHEWATSAEIPKLEIRDTGDAVVVTAEIPRANVDDITITVRGDVLTIRGKSRREEGTDRGSRQRLARTVRLGFSVEAERGTATFKNSVLTVILPKAPIKNGIMIDVKAA